MSDSFHNALIKLLAILLGLWGFVRMIDGLDHAGAFGKITAVIWGILVVITAIGFFRMRGWAFLLVSVGLLGSFFVTLIGLLMAIDHGHDVKAHALCFLSTIALIGYLGRWSMERRFRPHLETSGHH
ncbi:MAG TPA: hypothetical protein VFY93_13410 [Planctomycetota bacterium]|nr:hypothetical protein [Planctomycetota bacterium]